MSQGQQHWFWIDTLCMPLTYIQRPEMRLAFARSIKGISRSATQTVVVDPDHSLLSSNSDPREIFMRVAYSSWSTRLWTLLEAMYARRLVFRLSDRSVESDALLPHITAGAWETAWAIRFPYSALRRYLGSALDFQDPRTRTSDEYLCFLRQALHGRTTSNGSDEPLIIAGLLGIDQGEDELSRCMRILGRDRSSVIQGQVSYLDFLGTVDLGT